MTHNFCDTCNRIRVTCTGRLYPCLGQEAHADLRQVLRSGPDDGPVVEAIRAIVARKPRSHDFRIGAGLGPAVARPMSTTGG